MIYPIGASRGGSAQSGPSIFLPTENRILCRSLATRCQRKRMQTAGKNRHLPSLWPTRNTPRLTCIDIGNSFPFVRAALPTRKALRGE